MLKDEGMGELLPACNTMIFDEAHQLPETAGLFFGESLSTTQIIELARDARNEGIVGAKDYSPSCRRRRRALEKAARDLRLAVKGENLRLPAARIEGEAGFDEALQGLAGDCRPIRHLEAQAERGEGLANCLRRTQELAAALKRWRGTPIPKPAGLADEVVKWVEVYSAGAVAEPDAADIAPIFQRQMEGHPRAWIFTSATLAVGSNFSHYCGELGLTRRRHRSGAAPSTTNERAALRADPHARPEQPALSGGGGRGGLAGDPRQRGGRAFVLCTSLRAMRRIRELLQEKLAAEGFDLPLLMQGEGSRSELLERFRFLGNAILVASQSFWEGVDVRGEALSLVVIDKLPFAPPDDPVLAARIEHMRAAGRNPFMEYQLPRAVISMKQGSGRLIRDESDRGVLMICDPRLIGKPYGKARLALAAADAAHARDRRGRGLLLRAGKIRHMSAPHSRPQGRKPQSGAAQRRTIVTPSLGDGAGGRVRQ
jgi:ATP-dependent DNA helicase DinG